MPWTGRRPGPAAVVGEAISMFLQRLGMLRVTFTDVVWFEGRHRDLVKSSLVRGEPCGPALSTSNTLHTPPWLLGIVLLVKIFEFFLQLYIEIKKIIRVDWDRVKVIKWTWIKEERVTNPLGSIQEMGASWKERRHPSLSSNLPWFSLWICTIKITWK